MKTLVTFVMLAMPFFGIAQNPLLIPEAVSGTHFQLNLQNGEVEFYDGFSTQTIGYNQAILGPTLIMNQGDAVSIDVVNQLSEATTLHWHGLHVSAPNDGGPHTVIEPGQTWSPAFTVLDKAATYWYHPHLHQNTERQVTLGAAGFIIVRDAEEAALNLPRTYGVDDFPVVIQSRAFDANKQLMDNTALDDVILCNATLDAFLDIPAQVVRLRLLNGSTERVYNLGLDGNKTFYQIASDGGLLDAPVALTRLILAPGERAEILIDANNLSGQSLTLKSFASELFSGVYGAKNESAMPVGSIAGYSSNPLNGSDFEVLKLNVGAATTNPVTDIPASLIVNTPYSEASADAVRQLLFQPAQMGPTGMVNGPFVINGASFDLEVINYQIPLNNIEIWELQNMTAIAHPFHIHDVQFYVLDINGTPPPPNWRGRKDVILVPPMGGTVRFITKFGDHANSGVPYMYHCHMLSHEDDGMMGQFVVFDTSTGVDEATETPVWVFPNPVSDRLTLRGLFPASVELYDLTGRLLLTQTMKGTEISLDLSKYPSGTYLIFARGENQQKTFKVIKE